MVTAGLVAYIASGKSNLQWKKQTGASGQAGTSTYKGGNYCGPGWGFTYQDILDGKIKKMPAAIDAIDEACKAHDDCYAEHGYFTQGCNLVLTVDLVKVVLSDSSRPEQRADAVIMAAIFFIESQTIDVGKLAGTQLAAMKERIERYLAAKANTLDQAIQREIMNRTISPFGGP